MQYRTSTDRGFTLVEIIVSLAVFSIVALVALGALVKIISANKKAQTLQASISNLNFALETMSREMRVGARYNCSQTYPPPSTFSVPNNMTSQSCTNGTAVMFYSSNVINPGAVDQCNEGVVYRFRPDNVGAPTEYFLERAQQDQCSGVMGGSAHPFIPIVSDNVSITDYRLIIKYDQTNMPYPLAYIRLSGYAGAREREKERTYFEVQTAVSARLQ